MCFLDKVFNMKKRNRCKPEARAADLIESACIVAKDKGYRNMTRAQIAEQAGVSGPLVTHYMGGMDTVRDSVMLYAVQMFIPEIVAQGLMDGNGLAQGASDKLKAKAKETLSW